MESLEGQRVLEADLPGWGGLHEALVEDEEGQRLVCPLRDYPADFRAEQAGGGEAQVAAEGQGAGRRAVEEDGGAPGFPDGFLPLPLEDDDLVDEVGVMPRLGVPEGVAEGDDVCRGLLDDRVAVGFQQAQDRCLAGSGSTCEDI